MKLAAAADAAAAFSIIHHRRIPPRVCAAEWTGKVSATKTSENVFLRYIIERDSVDDDNDARDAAAAGHSGSVYRHTASYSLPVISITAYLHLIAFTAVSTVA